MREISECLADAKSELKRVDHLIYVSLKYTRTVDVILSVINRLVNAFGFVLDSLIQLNKKNIEDVPQSPAKKCNILKQIYIKDENILEMIRFYLFLRKLLRCRYRRINEFRRHVAMIAEVEHNGKPFFEVDIDWITKIYKDTNAYFEHIERLIEEK